MVYFLTKDTDTEGRMCLFQTKPFKCHDLWYPHSAENGFIDVSEDSLPLEKRDALIKHIKTEPLEVEITIKVKEK